MLQARIITVNAIIRSALRSAPVECSTAEKVRGTAVIIAPVPEAEPGAAHAVRGGDASEDGEAGRDVEVLVPVAFAQDKGSDLEVGAGSPHAGLRTAHVERLNRWQRAMRAGVVR
jgi:hypothetical protein